MSSRGSTVHGPFRVWTVGSTIRWVLAGRPISHDVLSVPMLPSGGSERRVDLDPGLLKVPTRFDRDLGREKEYYDL